MSERDFVLKRTARIERLLKQRGCEGSGLRAMAKSLKHYFSYDDWEELWWLGIQRNKFAHEEEPRLEDRARFERACEVVTSAIESIPMYPNHRFEGQSLFSTPRSYGYRPRRRSASPLGAVIVAAVGITMFIFMGSRSPDRVPPSALDDHPSFQSSLDDDEPWLSPATTSTLKTQPKLKRRPNRQPALGGSASANGPTPSDLDDFGSATDAPDSDDATKAEPLDLKASDLDDF